MLERGPSSSAFHIILGEFVRQHTRTTHLFLSVYYGKMLVETTLFQAVDLQSIGTYHMVFEAVFRILAVAIRRTRIQAEKLSRMNHMYLSVSIPVYLVPGIYCCTYISSMFIQTYPYMDTIYLVFAIIRQSVAPVDKWQPSHATSVVREFESRRGEILATKKKKKG